MNYSKNGLAVTESFENCKLTAYQDIKGIWTIGWGHTNAVHARMTCTQQQADEWLEEDTQSAVNTVNRLVTIGLSQPAFDALVDFVFNVGSGNFANSTMLKLLNAGNLDAAGEEFAKWSHASGVVVAGLLRRRLAEKAEFES